MTYATAHLPASDAATIARTRATTRERMIENATRVLVGASCGAVGPGISKFLVSGEAEHRITDIRMHELKRTENLGAAR